MSTPVQMLRFAMVGLASNAVLYLVYLGMTAAGMGPKLAMSMLYGIGVAQTFLFNKRWTFNHSGRFDAALLRYFAVYAGGYLANLLVLAWLVDVLRYPHQIVQGVMIVLLAGCFFLLQKFWVFPGCAENPVSKTV
jgi:putative flippase GtrA